MSEEKSNKVLYITPKKETIAASRELVSKLAPLSGSEALNMVLDHENPGELVKTMTKIDFSVFTNVNLNLMPITSIVADFFTRSANWQESA